MHELQERGISTALKCKSAITNPMLELQVKTHFGASPQFVYVHRQAVHQIPGTA